LEEKTEKATPKKRKDAREKEGTVLQSKEITVAASIFFAFFAFMILAKYMFTWLMQDMTRYLSAVGSFNNGVTESDLIRVLLTVIKDSVIILTPLVAVVCIVPIIAVLVQTKGLITFQPLRPKFSRLNPINGIKKLFSLQSWVNIIKGLIEIFAICLIVVDRIRKNLVQFHRLTDMEPIQGVAYVAKTALSIIMTITIVFVFVAVGDYIYQWWQYEKNLKMSKQEIKDEYKQIEGDPQIKSKIKQKQREVAMRRMMDQVPSADVVVRNPTHYAVALNYERDDTAAAPKVVAKGKDALALKIIMIAEENGVYVTENRPLARELYDKVDVGDEIPPSLYNALAIILTDMYETKGIRLMNNE